MNGITFVLLALITSTLSPLFSKSVLKPTTAQDSMAYAVISFLLTSVYAIGFYFLTSFHVQDFMILSNPYVLLLLLLDIVIWALGSCFYYPPYKHLPISETTITLSLQGVFALLFGLLLFHTETFHILRLLGGALVIFSVAIVSQEKGKWKFNKFTLLFLVATLLFGMGTVVDNTIIAHKFFSSVVFLMIFNFGITAFFIALFRPQTVKKLHTIYKDRKAALAVILGSFTNGLSFFFVYNAYKLHIVASQAQLLLATQTVFVVLLGVVVFKEKGSLRKKLFAGVIAMIGIYLVS